jgi:hypothetical protein
MNDYTAKIAEFARLAAVRACRAAGVAVADDATAYDTARACAAADGYAVAIGGRGVPSPATLALRCAIRAAEEASLIVDCVIRAAEEASLIVDDIAEMGDAAQRYVMKRAVSAEAAAMSAEAHAVGVAPSSTGDLAARRSADNALASYLA